MTTDTHLIPADSRLRTLRWRRFVIAFLISLGVLLALAAAAAFAYSSLHQGKILPGVAIAGVDVAGLTPAEAQDRLEASLPDVSSGALLSTSAASNAASRTPTSAATTISRRASSRR